MTSGESIDQYYTKLRSLARNCQFHNTDAEIKSQIIQRCQSETLRRHCLRDPDMNLGDLLNLTRTLERTEIQAKGMEKPGKMMGECYKCKQNTETDIKTQV